MLTFRLDTFLLSTAWYYNSSAGITSPIFFKYIDIINYTNASKHSKFLLFFLFFLENWSFISRSLKSFVTPMIAGLLESNQKIRWTFDKYFNSTNDIMNKITVKVFDCSTGINNKLYIDKTDRYVCHDAIHLFWRKKRWL